MNRYNKYWRPELFSALGAGFKSDSTIEDGIHLRWILDSLMGLPFQYTKTGKGKKTNVGGFKVYYNMTAERSINKVNLFNTGNYGAYSILTNSTQSQMRSVDGGFQFLRSYRQEFLKPYWQLAYYTDVLRGRLNLFPNSYNGKKILMDFMTYMDEVLEKLKPGEMLGNFAYSEVCAVDISIAKSVRRVTGAPANSSEAQQWHKILFPTSSTSQPPILDINIREDISINESEYLFTQFKNKVWFRIKAYDRHDRLVAEDWLGQYGKNPFTILGQPTTQKNTYKLRAQLRAPGIQYIKFEQVIAQKEYILQDLRWLFCEDYCQHEKLWLPVRLGSEVYKSFPEYYTPETMKQEFFQPFRKAVDWNDSAALIRNHMVKNPDNVAMLSSHLSFNMYQHRTNFDGDDTNRMEIPTLGALLSASVEPLMAKVLGLYHYVDHTNPLYADLDGRDFKIEGQLPFFQSENLKWIESYFAQFLYGNPNIKLINWNKDQFQTADLCGLVLGATVSPKPQPVPAKDFSTKIHINDFPSPDVPDQSNLMVQSKLDIPYDFKDNIDIIKPYLHPVAFELLRKISDGPILNVIKAEETDPGPLDELAILPPVYFPRSQDIEDKQIRLRDSFLIPAIQEEELLYYLRSFDIFGRPSITVKGEVQTIELPCYVPTAPTAVKAELRKEGGQVNLKLQFSLDTDRPSLQAVWNDLEIEIHQIPDGGDTPPGNLQWSGSKVARKFTLPFDAVNSELIPFSLSQSCVSLLWVGGILQRTPLADTACATAFPSATPLINSINPANLLFEETGFRTFMMSLPIAEVSQLGTGTHRWNMRLRVHGTCTETGTSKFSEEVCVAERILITPSPPRVEQPPIVRIPVSTYSDTKGDAYYMLDLEDFLTPANLSAGPLVNVYQATLDRIPNGMDLVSGPDLLNQAEFITLAKQFKTRFELQTPEPVKVNATNRFFPIKVPGDLQQYHIVGVLGTNAYLEEKSWSQAGMFLFRTPEPLPDPVLNFMRADTALRASENTVDLRYSCTFNGLLPNSDQPPRLQLMRRDLSRLDNVPPLFISTIEGILTASNTDTATYQFDYRDNSLTDWRRYRYEVYLLRYDDLRNQYIKTRQYIQNEVLADWGKVDDPLLETDTFTIINNAVGKTIEVDFALGEFKFSLLKVLEDGSKVRYEGKIKNGNLYGQDADHSTLTTVISNSKYRLTIQDNEPTEGEYTFRLSFGLYNWSKKLTP